MLSSLLVASAMDGVAELIGRHGVSDRALAQIWGRATGEKKGKVRKRIDDTLREEVLPCIRPVIPPWTGKGPPQRQFVVKPALALQLVLQRCGEFSDFFWKVLHPDGRNQTVGTQAAPLRCVFYTDEVTPGNAMDPANSRKFSAWYWSWLELGRWKLMRSWAWQICGIFKSTHLKDIDGGLGWCCSTVLREFFARDQGAFATQGLVLHFGHKTARVFFKYEGMIADEEALHMCWSVKGSSGNRICMKCRNVVRKGSELAGANDDYWVCHDCSDPSRFDPETDADLFYAADTLAAASRMTGVTRLRELEKAFGLTYSPNGPLWDQELRAHITPVSGTRCDPCHTWFSNGIVHVELQCFFAAAAEKLGNKTLDWSVLEEVCSSDWRFPGEAKVDETRGRAARMFRDRVISEQGYARISASEALVAVHLILFFVERIVANFSGIRVMQRETASLRAMCLAGIAYNEAWRLAFPFSALALR